jgi:tryptophanyl-tRNA synthetase
VRLLDDAETIQRKFKRAVTDSGTEIKFDETRPAITNLLTIYQLLTGSSWEQVESHFAGAGYAKLKQELADSTSQFLEPIQKRAQAIDDGELTRILERGADKARGIASATLATVKERFGITSVRSLPPDRART